MSCLPGTFQMSELGSFFLSFAQVVFLWSRMKMWYIFLILILSYLEKYTYLSSLFLEYFVNTLLMWIFYRGGNALLGPEDIENPKRALENGA